MLRRLMTPDPSRQRRGKKGSSSSPNDNNDKKHSRRGVDPKGSFGNVPHDSSSESTSTLSHNNNNSNSSNMRRGGYPRSAVSGGSTASHSNSNGNNNNNEEDKQRLRSFLRGAMTRQVVTTSTEDEQHSKSMLKRVLARSQSMDQHQHRTTTAASSSVMTVNDDDSSGADNVNDATVVIPASSSSVASQRQQHDSHAGPPTASARPRRLERVDANPMATDFRNRLRQVTTAAGSPSRPKPPGDAPTTTTMTLDAKTREMIQDRFRRRHEPKPVASHPPPPPPRVNHHRVKELDEEEEKRADNDPDLEGYDAFFQTLKQEVHGQHALLWASFKAVMKHERPPELEALPPAAKNPFRFDKRTKEMLTMMNAYTQEKPHVVHVSSTQLVNDKKFAKELKKQQFRMGGDCSKPPVAPEKETEPKLHVETKEEGPIDVVPTAASSSSSLTKRHGDRYTIATQSESASLPSSTAATAQNMDFENVSNSGVEVTLGQFESKTDESSKKPRPSQTPTSDVSSIGATLWNQVQLRSVRSDSEQKTSKTPNFAKVQLRKITPPTEAKQQQQARALSVTTTTEDDNAATVDSAAVDDAKGAVEGQVEDTARPEKAAVPEPPPAPRPRPPEATVATTEPSHKDPAPRKESVDKSKSKPDKKKIDEAVYVNLKPTAEDAKKDDQTKVIIGRKNIMIVKAKAGDMQADVLWKMPRTDAVSLNIDMTRLMVKLIAKDGSILRQMTFDASGDCLKFANAFYEKLASASSDNHKSEAPTDENEEMPKTEIPNAVLEAADEDEDTEFAAVRLERLNDEEQTVLDTYRRLRLSKPPKDALAESVSKDSGTNAAPTVQTAKPSLSVQDEAIASKYRKMLKLKIPVEAVEHSMQKDGIAHHIADAVLQEVRGVPKNVAANALPSSPVSTFSNGTALSEADAQIVERFKKMLKMRIPQDAVKHKLMVEGIDSRLHDFIFEGTGSGEGNKSMENALSPADEAVAAHYRKLISRGVPKESVRHGMAKDNVAAHIVTAVLGGTEEPDHSSAPPLPKKDPENDLSAEEQRIASEFKKLLKRQIPRQQLLDRMRKEGVSQKVMVAVLGKRGLSIETKNDGAQSKGNSSRFVQIHWTPLAGSQLENSVWNTKKSKSNDVAPPEGTAFSKLKELFEKKTNNSIPKDKSANKSSDGPNKAKLLDINRSNNVAISLKAFKDYSFAELADIIKFLDPLRKLQGERVHFLRDLLPTISETNLVQAYDGPDSRLEPAELWFKSIVHIKRIEAKVHVLRTMEMLEVESRSIGENLRLLTKVCNQVMDSEKLQDLLVMVLQVGNIMNEGTRTGGASGFKLDSLLKLTQTKSADGKTTVLDYLVEDVFIAKGERHKLELTCDFPECSTASRMLIGDLVAEVKAMQDSVAQCNEELEALSKEAHANSGGVKSVIANIESQEKNSIYGAIERLKTFVVSAENIIKHLIIYKDEALKASRELCMYCGEGSGTAAATSLLGILSEFATNIESAVKKSDEKRKAKERKQKRQAADGHSVTTTESKQEDEGNGESLVLLVNKMLKDANPRLVEDFKKGRRLENPSNLMKTIYYKEQTREGQRASLATAIQEKAEDLDKDEFLTARNKFGSPRENLQAQNNAARSSESTIDDTTPARSNSKNRAPPLPWSPPVHNDPPKDQSPSSSAVASDRSETASFVTDASTTMTSCTDEPVENLEPYNKRPASRPTPEGMPLRDKPTPANLASSSTDDAATVSKRFTGKPTPETGIRDVTKPTPESCSRRPPKGTAAKPEAKEEEDTPLPSIDTPTMGGPAPSVDEKTAPDTTKELPSTAQYLDVEQKPDRAHASDNTLCAEPSETSNDGPDTTPPKSSDGASITKASVSVSDGTTTRNATPSSQNTTVEVTDATQKGKPGRVSALAAAFSKPNASVIQPVQSSHFTSTMFALKSTTGSTSNTAATALESKKLDTAPAEKDPGSVSPASDESETVLPTNDARSVSPGSEESATSIPTKDPASIGHETETASPANTGEERHIAPYNEPLSATTVNDSSQKASSVSSTAEPVSAFQSIRNRLQEKRDQLTSSGGRPDPPCESKPIQEVVEDQPDLPTPVHENDESKFTEKKMSKESPATETSNASSRPVRHGEPSISADSVQASTEGGISNTLRNETERQKSSPRFSLFTRPWKNRSSPEKSKGAKDIGRNGPGAPFGTTHPEGVEHSPASSVSAEKSEKAAQDTTETTEENNSNGSDSQTDDLFDISAAQGRLSVRKSMEGNLSQIRSPNAPAINNGIDSNSKKAPKSLQELAMLKRERRSMEKSPMKKPGEPEEHRTTDVPSISGYLELARQRRDGKRPSGSGNKASPLPAQATQKTAQKTTLSSDKKENTKGESLFARMAREKRASRKGA